MYLFIMSIILLISFAMIYYGEEKDCEGIFVIGLITCVLTIIFGFVFVGILRLAYDEESVRWKPEEVLIGEKAVLIYDQGRSYSKDLASDLIKVRNGAEILLEQNYAKNAYGYRMEDGITRVIIVEKEKE